MKCDQVRQAFSDLYDERLSGPPLVTITQHLATCQECRAEWTDFRKAMLAVSDLGGAEPSLGFAGRRGPPPPPPPPAAPPITKPPAEERLQVRPSEPVPASPPREAPEGERD